MSPEFVLMFVLAFVVAVYGVYKHENANTGDYNNVVTGIREDRIRIKTLEDKVADLEGVRNQFTELTNKVSEQLLEFEKQVDASQEHSAKLREAVIELRDRLSRRGVKVLPPVGPIQVEILHPTPKPKPKEEPLEVPPLPPTKPIVKKVKKQLEDLSK